MSAKVSLWCRCGNSMTASSDPESASAQIGEMFHQLHSEPGCEVTDDPIKGRGWAKIARWKNPPPRRWTA